MQNNLPHSLLLFQQKNIYCCHEGGLRFRVMPLYRPSSGAAKSGLGVSNDGYEGANTLFEQAKSVLGDIGSPFVPSNAAEASAGKAAADAYLASRNGTVPQEFPSVTLDESGASGPMDIGKALSEMMTNMGDMLNQVLTAGPMGILSQLMSFLFKLFTNIASGIGQALTETARAAASAIEEALKKQMEMASAAGQGLQPLELYMQSATTQTLSHALNNSTST